MIFKCVAMSAQVGELGDILYDFEFDGHDGSSIMIANTTSQLYQLGCLYDIKFDTVVPTETKEPE